MTERSQAIQTASHDELLARYHAANAHATDALPAARRQAMRERILQAAAHNAQSKEMTSVQAAVVPAANDSFWSIKAVAILAVMGLAALLYLQLGDQAQQEQGKPQADAAPASKAAATAAAAAPPVASMASPPPAAPTAPRAPAAPAVSPEVASAASPAPQASRPRETVKEKKLSQDSAVAARAQEVAPVAPVAAPAQSAPPPVATAKSAADKEAPAKPTTQMLAPEARSGQELDITSPNFGARSRANAILGSPSPSQREALLLAIARSDAAALSSALSQENASPNIKNAQGVPALHLAVSRRWTEGVRLLLAAGADSQAQDAEGLSALELAKKIAPQNEALLQLFNR